MNCKDKKTRDMENKEELRRTSKATTATWNWKKRTKEKNRDTTYREERKVQARFQYLLLVNQHKNL